MKTTIKEKFKSIYQAILEHFRWLYDAENKRRQWFESEEEQEDEVLRSLVPEPKAETIIEPTIKEIYIPTRNQLTKKQLRMLEIVEGHDSWVDSSKIGDIFCQERYGENARAGGSMYASKTLNKLVKYGFLVKNNKKKYKKA
jgi:hypothetical protein